MMDDSQTMTRPRAFTLLAVGLLAALTTAACNDSGASAAPPNAGGRGRGGRGRGGEGGAVPVTTAVVAQRDVPVDIAAIGNVEAYVSVSLRPQVTGVITEVRFHEGDFVKKDDHLFTIDARPFQAMLEQARANLARDRALLSQAEAQLARDKAQADYLKLASQRNLELAERGILSKDTLQQSQAQAAANAAAVNADQAAVESARAQLGAQQALVDNATLQLAYTVIRSPIAGRTGNLTMKPGNLATANTTELTTIAQVEPVYVTFSVPAVRLSAIRAQNGRGPLMVTAARQDDSSPPVTGKLAFVDNMVDASTDTIRLKARFDNANHQLWPGEFARVSLRLETLPGATVVSGQAVQTGQDGPFVFVVKDDATVEQRAVTITQRISDDVVIGKGLQPGETVVTEGQLRLEPGSKIQQAGAGEGGRGGAGRSGGGDRGGGDRGGRRGAGRGAS
jgi:multidrug efflux system membrane fusion protein